MQEAARAGRGRGARCSRPPPRTYSELPGSRGRPGEGGRVAGKRGPAGHRRRRGGRRYALLADVPGLLQPRRPRRCSRGAGRGPGDEGGAKPWRGRDPTGGESRPHKRPYFSGHIFLLYLCVEEIVPFGNDFFLCALPALVPAVRAVGLTSSLGSASASGICTLYLTPQTCFLGS